MVRFFYFILLILLPFNAWALAPVEYQSQKFSLVTFFSGEHQDFVGPASYLGFYLINNIDSQLETPNNVVLGLKAGQVDKAVDKVLWFIKRDISFSNLFYLTLKYNHSVYRSYQLGENTFSGLLNFQGFFNPTNLFYMSIGAYYRVPNYSDYYRVPLYPDGSGSEFYFLASMGYKYFSEGDAFSIDINNFNDFQVYNLNNIGIEMTFSSFMSETSYYLVSIELRTSGFLAGTGTINEEKFMFGLGFNF